MENPSLCDKMSQPEMPDLKPALKVEVASKKRTKEEEEIRVLCV